MSVTCPYGIQKIRGCSNEHPLFLSLSRHRPASEHGEVVYRLQTIFLYRHRDAEHHPSGRLVAGDADGLVGADAGETRHVGDIGPGVVFVGWCPARDNRPDGIEAIGVVVGMGEQLECCSPTVLKCFKLTELSVCLHGPQAFPLVFRPADVDFVFIRSDSAIQASLMALASPDVQGVVVTNSSWHHKSIFLNS